MRLSAPGIDVRYAVPLSLLFAGLLTDCWAFNWEDCGDVEGGTIDAEVVVTEAEFRYFAQEDGELDFTECRTLCTCLLQGYRPWTRPGTTREDAGEAGTDDGGSDAVTVFDGDPDEAGHDGGEDATELDADASEAGTDDGGEDVVKRDADGSLGEHREGGGGAGGASGGVGPGWCNGAKQADFPRGQILSCEPRQTTPDGRTFHCGGTRYPGNSC
jgi:hypothetical protein